MSNSKNDKDFLNEARLNSKTRRERPKRRIVPNNVKVSKSPPLVNILNDALSIIGSELAYYKDKSQKGQHLDLKEARAVSSYMDSLVKMSREAREAQKPEQLEHLSDAELIEIVKQAEAESDSETDNVSKTKSDSETDTASEAQINPNKDLE